MKTHIITKDNKKIKVKKYDTGFEFHYDSTGNKIYCRYPNGFEVWNEYDENNNLIHYRNSNRFEEWYEYDSNGNKIYHKFPDRFEEWYEYDENNNEIHYKNSNEFEYWQEYDENNNLIYYRNSDEYEEFYINNTIVSKEEWFKYYYLSKFDYKYIYDIIGTLKDNNQKINIDNIRKHLNGIEIEDLEEKYKKVLKHCEIIQWKQIQ